MKKKTETRSEFDRYELYLLNTFLSELKQEKEKVMSVCTCYTPTKKRCVKREIEQIDNLQAIIENKEKKMLEEVI